MENKVLFFAGDFVYKGNKKVEIISPLKDMINGDSVVFSVNFEAPVEGSGKPIHKAGPVICQSKESVDILSSIGVNILNLANNHIYDYGIEGLIKTLDILSPFTCTGAGNTVDDAFKMKTIQLHNTKIGFLSFAENGYGAICNPETRHGYAWINHDAVNNLVADSRKKVDILIIQVHAGVEEIEIPLPEWRQRYRELVDLGASAIIGHHPHVPQGYEIYKDAPIFYSLGNFYVDLDSCDPMSNKGIIAKLTVNHDLKINAEAMPIERCGNSIFLSEDADFINYIKTLNNKLNEPQYSSLIEEIVTKLWQERYKPYILRSFNGLERFNPFRILNIIRKLLSKRKTDEELFHHLLFIESHYYVIRRALNINYKNTQTILT
jgi:poly-gamma-glutamate synthesis protein (capsule biosynthesis protein)